MKNLKVVGLMSECEIESLNLDNEQCEAWNSTTDDNPYMLALCNFVKDNGFYWGGVEHQYKHFTIKGQMYNGIPVFSDGKVLYTTQRHWGEIMDYVYVTLNGLNRELDYIPFYGFDPEDEEDYFRMSIKG